MEQFTIVCHTSVTAEAKSTKAMRASSCIWTNKQSIVHNIAHRVQLVTQTAASAQGLPWNQTGQVELLTVDQSSWSSTEDCTHLQSYNGECKPPPTPTTGQGPVECSIHCLLNSSLPSESTITCHIDGTLWTHHAVHQLQSHKSFVPISIPIHQFLFSKTTATAIAHYMQFRLHYFIIILMQHIEH